MSGESGIRTHAPKKDDRISSAARYDHFDISPYSVIVRNALHLRKHYDIVSYYSTNSREKSSLPRLQLDRSSTPLIFPQSSEK